MLSYISMIRMWFKQVHYKMSALIYRTENEQSPKGAVRGIVSVLPDFEVADI